MIDHLTEATKRIHRRGERSPSALTPTELRVAELVCAGHTNSSAARELFVSASTISTHLRSIYAKLHVNSRVLLVLALQAESTLEAAQAHDRSTDEPRRHSRPVSGVYGFARRA
jgi:DNA-binding CsgD family transcriptional regulator